LNLDIKYNHIITQDLFFKDGYQLLYDKVYENMDKFIITIGGDHSIAAGNVGAIVDYYNIVKNNIHPTRNSDWDYFYLSLNKNITWNDFYENIDNPWYLNKICEKETVTFEIIKNNHRFDWNYKYLSNNSNITINNVLENLTIINKWDFKALSKNKNFTPEIIDKYKQFNWDIDELCKNPSLTWEMICNYPHFNWNYDILSMHKNINWTIIENNIDKKWNFKNLSLNPNITWNIVKNNLDKNWSFKYLSLNPNITWNIILNNSNYNWSLINFLFNNNLTVDSLEFIINKIRKDTKKFIINNKIQMQICKNDFKYDKELFISKCYKTWFYKNVLEKLVNNYISI
jgi:hypothetical protein